MGLASGYPMDAVITCKFRKNNLCSAIEAERLLSFTNTADPLFMFGAVAVGMFAMPEMGAILALSHYLSSFLVGIIFRFHGKDRESKQPTAPKQTSFLLLRAFRAMNQARREDGRPFGQLLGDAVRTSMNTILLIGGFIILFSVFLRIISVTQLTSALTSLFACGLQALGWHTSLASALVTGLFEIDLGSLAASQTNAPLAEKIAITSAIIAWSGLSVHGQVASIVIESGIRMTPYMISRLLHAFLAALISLLLIDSPFLSHFFISPVFATTGPDAWLFHLQRTGQNIFYCLAFLLAFSLMWSTLRRCKTFLQKK